MYKKDINGFRCTKTSDFTWVLVRSASRNEEEVVRCILEELRTIGIHLLQSCVDAPCDAEVLCHPFHYFSSLLSLFVVVVFRCTHLAFI